MSAIQPNRITEDDAPLTPVYGTPIEHPGAWKVADFKTPADYTIELGAIHLRDIERAMRQIKAAGLGLDDLRREHFDFPSLRPVIDEIRHEIKDGRGFVVLRHLPVEDYSKDEIGMIFWGIGTYLGRGLSQSVLGDRLGHVKDFSREDPLARAYRNKQELLPHTDSCDLVGLACLRNAESGGVSRLTSALTVHNVMLEEYPEALERLYRGYVFHRRGEEKPGDLPHTPYRVPLYSNTEGKVIGRMEQVEASIARYLRALDRADREESDIAEAKSVRLKEKIAGLRRQMHALKVMEQTVHDAPDQQVSLTDPDTRSMATSGKGTATVGYNVQIAVDAAHHLIVAHEVINQGYDRHQLAPMAFKAQEATGCQQVTAVADRGYFNGDQVLSCEGTGVAPVVAKTLTSSGAKRGFFTRQDFIYDAEHDHYTCPAGAKLTKARRRADHTEDFDF